MTTSLARKLSAACWAALHDVLPYTVIFPCTMAFTQPPLHNCSVLQDGLPCTTSVPCISIPRTPTGEGAVNPPWRPSLSQGKAWLACCCLPSHPPSSSALPALGTSAAFFRAPLPAGPPPRTLLHSCVPPGGTRVHHDQDGAGLLPAPLWQSGTGEDHCRARHQLRGHWLGVASGPQLGTTWHGTAWLKVTWHGTARLVVTW